MRTGAASACRGAMVVAALLASSCGTDAPSTSTSSSDENAVPSPDRGLVLDYFHHLNAAARHGPHSEQDFLDATQHPDFRADTCSLGASTLEIDPSISTLRRDPLWRTGDAGARPRGTVYVVAVQVVARQHGERVDSQIGSQHVVVLNGTVHGFAPCSS